MAGFMAGMIGLVWAVIRDVLSRRNGRSRVVQLARGVGAPWDAKCLRIVTRMRPARTRDALVGKAGGIRHRRLLRSQICELTSVSFAGRCLTTS